MTISPDHSGIIRHPAELLLKLWYCISQRKHGLSGKTALRLLLAKALSYYNEYKNCPIIVPYCRFICKRLGFLKPKFEPDGYHRYYRTMLYDSDITITMRAHFEFVYGIPPRLQQHIEKALIDGFTSSHICRIVEEVFLSYPGRAHLAEAYKRFIL